MTRDSGGEPDTGTDLDTDVRQPPATPSPEALQALHELQQMPLTTPMTEVLGRVAALAQETIPGVAQASVTLVRAAGATTVAFTGDLAVHLDERQYEAGFGPCTDAAATGSVVEVPDTASEELYRDFARLAARVGVTNSLSVGMPIAQETTGAINLYGTAGPGSLAGTARWLCHQYAGWASIAVANAELHSQAVERASHLEQAMASRAVIEQAKGMVMCLQGCSADDAFRVLAKVSQRTNRKLRDLAQRVVDSSPLTRDDLERLLS